MVFQDPPLLLGGRVVPASLRIQVKVLVPQPCSPFEASKPGKCACEKFGAQPTKTTAGGGGGLKGVCPVFLWDSCLVRGEAILDRTSWLALERSTAQLRSESVKV